MFDYLEMAYKDSAYTIVILSYADPNV